jgi:hypothetical protein
VTDWAGIIGARAGRYIAVVRRGETAVLRALLRTLEAQPGPVQVIWDRRGAERRKSRRPGSPEPPPG